MVDFSHGRILLNRGIALMSENAEWGTGPTVPRPKWLECSTPAEVYRIAPMGCVEDVRRTSF